ncbi:unnamed protein product, partial [Protopolystoma xenopodis]
MRWASRFRITGVGINKKNGLFPTRSVGSSAGARLAAGILSIAPVASAVQRHGARWSAIIMLSSHLMDAEFHSARSPVRKLLSASDFTELIAKV